MASQPCLATFVSSSPCLLPALPLRSRLIQLPLKRILRKPANFFPESNQFFVRHVRMSGWRPILGMEPESLTADAHRGNTAWGIAMQPIPRKLTTHQQAVLIQVLLAFPDQEVGVYYCASASDALGYAQDFLTVFKAIGWNVNEGTPSEGLSDDLKGLAFVATGRDSLPPAAEALRDALRIYEIEVATFSDPTCNMRPGGFILSVGSQASSNIER